MGVSIRKRKDRPGKWQVVIDFGKNEETGKRQTQTEEADSYRAAQLSAAKWRVKLAEGTARKKSGLTISSLFDSYIEQHVSRLRPRSQEEYTRGIKLHILPALGKRPVQEIGPEEVSRFLSGLTGARTPQLCHVYLCGALDLALSWGLVTRNVARLVKPPQAPPTPPRPVWTQEEAATFLGLSEERCSYGPIFRLCLATGLRRGELLGLRWEDIDLEQGLLRVFQQLHKGGQDPRYGPPKSDSGYRTLAIDPEMVLVLKDHKAAQEERAKGTRYWQACGLVFCTEIGTPISPRNLNRQYDNLVREAGVPRIHLHDQRHTHGSWGIMRGWDPKTVSERLGHKDVKITLDRYTHIDSATHRRAADDLGSMLPKRKKEDVPHGED